FYSLIYSFFFSCSPDHRNLHSFPTRRSSDLARHVRLAPLRKGRRAPRGDHSGHRPGVRSPPVTRRGIAILVSALFALLTLAAIRSEEHTSELQSRGHLVCRLLLEKKKKELIR